MPAEHLVGDLIRQGDPRHGIIWRNLGRVSGAPCFYGTRIPVQNLFDALEAGETIESFLAGFPPLTREHVLAVLELARQELLRGTEAA